MADLGLDGAAPFEKLRQRRGDASSLTADQNAGGLDAMAAIALKAAVITVVLHYTTTGPLA